MRLVPGTDRLIRGGAFRWWSALLIALMVASQGLTALAHHDHGILETDHSHSCPACLAGETPLETSVVEAVFDAPPPAVDRAPGAPSPAPRVIDTRPAPYLLRAPPSFITTEI